MRNNTKIKLAYIIPTLNYGGAERQLMELCAHLDSGLFEIVIILLRDEDKLFKHIYRAKINTKIIKIKRNARFDVRKILELRRILNEEKPRIIHTFLPTANFWGCLAARLSGRPQTIIASSRGMHYRFLDKWTLLNFISLNLLSDHLVVNSEAVKDNCTTLLRVKPDRITKINNGVIVGNGFIGPDKEYLRSQSTIADKGAPVIATIGRLDSLKGVDYLLEAAGILEERKIRANIVIAGEGPLRVRLEEKTKALGLTERVKFLGEIDNVAELLSITDIFVLPTLSEGCSNVILEAMSMGCAIVTTAIAANKELLEDDESGLLVPSKDPKALAEGLIKLMHDAQLRRRLGDRARQRVKEGFSVDKMVREYEKFYCRLTGCYESSSGN